MKRLLSVAALVALLLVVVGCGGSDSDSTSAASSEASSETTESASSEETGGSEEAANTSGGESAEGMKIGISSLSQSLPFVAKIVEGIENKAQEDGAETILTDAQAKSDKQTSDIQDLLSQSPNGIVMIPVDSKVAQGQVNQIESRGIPVVAAGVAVGDPLKRPLKEVYPGLTALVTQDEPKSGEQAAELVEQALPDGGEIAIVLGQPGFAENTTRVQKFTERLEGSGKTYDIVAEQPGNWVPEDAQAVCANLLSSNPGIELFYTLSDDMAIGCENAINAAGSEAKIVSIGGYKEVLDAMSRSDIIYGTICYRPVQMGEVAAEELIAKLNGEDIEAQFESYPTYAVTKKTMSKCPGQV